MPRTLEFKWTVSRARDSYGYNICSLYVDGQKVSACNGGGYDMKGTSLGSWIETAYRDRLLALKPSQMEKLGHYDHEKKARVKDGRGFYGLTFHNPKFDPGKATASSGNKTVAEAEAAGETIGLERYQAIYSASSKVPTKTHVVPSIDGGCGFSSVERIMKAIGLTMEYIPVRSKNLTIYRLHDAREKKRAA